ncbi:hypothetical protein A2U01_0055579, partial [Trifolium medium]|nr:hypothetical protein [Trifolium medium]
MVSEPSPWSVGPSAI